MTWAKLRWRHFVMRQIKDARAWARQPLHVAVHDTGRPYTSRTGRTYQHTCHLFTPDRETMLVVARKLNLDPRWIQYPGTPKEHLDVFGGPLERILRLCTTHEEVVPCDG